MARWFSELFGAGARFVAGAQTLQKSAGPNTPSADAAAMAPKWKLISDVMEGSDAIKAAGPIYLPKFENETEAKYRRRLADAPWRPDLPAAIEAITSKPFSKPVTLSGTPSEKMSAFADDVDTRGNNLHVFARTVFDVGVTYGVAALFVDYTRTIPRGDGRPLSIAEERAQGARPYWLQIKPQDLISIRTRIILGKESVVHARWWECSTEDDGFAEKFVRRIRVIELDAVGTPHWSLLEEQTNGEFVEIASGDLSIPEIPLVLFYTGKRKGGGFAVKPPMYDLAIVALEHYRAMARSTEIENFSGWPTLVGVGMGKPEETIEVGPATVLYAPPAGSEGKTDWKIIGPDAALVAEVAKSPERVMEAFNKLAMEPTIPRANVTATAAGIDNSRAHSAIEAWAGALQDALNQALRFTAMWLKEPDATTATVATDFVSRASSSDEARVLGDAQKRGVISAKTERAELKRRSILSPEFDEESEELQIAAEQQGLEPEGEIDPTSGDVVPFERVAS